MTSDSHSIFAGMQVREFQDGQSVAEVMLVRGAETRRRRNGDEFLKLTLGDRSANVTAIVSEGLADAIELCRLGVAVWVAGRFEVHERFGRQLAVESTPGRQRGRVRHR